MISTAAEYQRELQRLAGDAETARRQHAALVEVGLSGRELGRAMAPLLSFRAGLVGGVRVYERSGGSPG